MKPNKQHFRILDDLSGTLRPGRITLLLGPPGAGKSTLLNALAGRLQKSPLKVASQSCTDTMPRTRQSFQVYCHESWPVVKIQDEQGPQNLYIVECQACRHKSNNGHPHHLALDSCHALHLFYAIRVFGLQPNGPGRT